MTRRVGQAIVLSMALAAAPAVAQQAGHHPGGAQAGASHGQMQSDRPMPGMGMMQGMRGGADAGGGDATRGAMMGGEMMSGMHLIAPLFGMHAMGPVEHVEGRLAFLRAELDVTDAQQAAWNSFTEVLRKNAKDAAASPSMMMVMQATSAPERLKAMESHLTGRLEAFRASRAAVEQLYPQLTDGQKKSLDALLSPPMGGMMAHR
jgi:hypothetical protein